MRIKIFNFFVIMLLLSTILSSGFDANKLHAAPALVSAYVSQPSSMRSLCSSGVPVDFSVRPSNVSFNIATGLLSYNINIDWRRCDSSETRAYAIYSDPELCPYSGIYGAPPTGWVTDCVKYIGSPAYSGVGNGLQCWGGTNGQCVTANFTGARVAENQPGYTTSSKTIPMSAQNSLWAFAPNDGSWSISKTMCQFYKKGVNFSEQISNSRCETVTIGVTWTSLKDFKLSPYGNVSLDENESPSAATFNGGISNINNIAVGGVTVSRAYQLRKLNGGKIDLGTSTSVVNVGSTTLNLPTESKALSGIVLNTGDKICQTISINRATGKVRTDNGSVYQVDSSASQDSCSPIYNKPYVTFYGGDVNTCGGINTFYNSAGSFGSGVQYAAQAYGAINQFSSARGTSIGSGPKVLSFANNVQGNLYGGLFGDGGCTTQRDYFADKPTITMPSPVNVAVDNLPAGKVLYNGNVSLSGTIQNGRRTALYVDGDLSITGNINYAQDTNWATLADIPSLHIYVKGNIYIQPGVTTLTGFYVAQKNDTGVKGIIDTCANGFTSYTNLTDIWDFCKTTLSVRGAFASNQTLFRRGNSSLRNGADMNNEKSGYLSSNAAERFYLGPEMYLVGPDTTSSGGSGGAGGYQYEVVLPPLL